jgi:signal transduction histidine kinase
MRSYLEVPLRTKGGAVIGSYCVVHTNPRDFSQRDILTLAEIATCIVDHLNLLRYKQEHDRAQHLIQGLGTIVASSLESPLSGAPALPPAPIRSPHVRLGVQDREATPAVAAESTKQDVVDVAVDDTREMSSHTVDLSQRFEDFRLNETSSRRKAVSTPFPTSETQTRSTNGVLSDQKEKHDRSFDEDEHSILADITELIYKHNDIDGVLVLDAPSETAPADEHSRPPSSCKEVGTRLGSDGENVAMAAYRRSKHLSTSVLRGLLYRHPAGKILRREKDAPMLDAFVRSDGRADLLSDTAAPSPLNDEEYLFEYLGGPLQIILAPMWAATHRNGLLCTVCWTRDRARNFEDEDVALLSAFCNSALANLARKDAISTMQAKSRFMESISHELRSPIHGILASADLLDEQCTDAGSRSLLTNIQSCGATLLDTMNQLLIYTEMSSTKSGSSGTGLPTTAHDKTPETNDDVANEETHINLGTLVEEVVDAISVSHTLNESHGKELETERKRSVSIRTIHNVLVPVPTVVTIHPEAAKRVRIQVGAFRRLLMILYSNALQHTSHGHVEVELRLKEEVGEDVANAIQLVVRDSGRGISQRFMDSQMFLPFSQEHATSAGIGLGLNIAQRLVRNLGGTIDVESKEEIGTTMQVTIPLTERMVQQEGSDDSTIFLPTLLRRNISGRSICIINLVEGHEVPQKRLRPSIYDTTNTVLVRSLKTILSECFGVQIVLDESIAEAFLDVDDGQVFMSSTTNPIADGLKIQNPYVRVYHAHRENLLTSCRISPRAVAAALVQLFDLTHVLDQETRDLLQIYQPLDLRETVSPAAAPAPASTLDIQAAYSEESSSYTHFTDGEIGDVNKTSTEDTIPNCLLVDDNEVNLKVRRSLPRL